MTYTYTCVACQEEHDEIRKVEARNEIATCKCGNYCTRKSIPDKLTITGLLFLGGAATKTLRDEKYKEALDIIKEGKQKSTADKAATVAALRGDYNYTRDRENTLNDIAQGVAKFVDDNKSLVKNTPVTVHKES